MLTRQMLLDKFKIKLEKTNSLDDAFMKAVWDAYNEGLVDGRAEAEGFRVDPVACLGGEQDES